MPYEVVIGLEVHIQLATRSKIFCSCPVGYGSDSNSHVCPVCLGLPGSLPILNRHSLELALLTACATGCRISQVSRFDRKQYFYPDLPKGYQITQYSLPLAVDGFLEIDVSPYAAKRIGINRIHLEEDAGRLLHECEGLQPGFSIIDYNRAGIPLIEVVSGPDMRTPEEAGAYLRGLHMLVQYLGVSDGSMEQGSFRCDANISIRSDCASPLGTKVELKNLNSFRHVERALTYEMRRQADVVAVGNRVVHETRLWDEEHAKTVVMRVKEGTSDYRYFPEPDLSALEIDIERVKQLIAQIPELPRAKKKRFIDMYALSEYDADCLTRTCQVADYFEETVAFGVDPKQVCNWIMGDVARTCCDMHAVQSFVVTPMHLAELIRMLDAGIINKKIAKVVFEEIIATSLNPKFIVEKKSLAMIADFDELEGIVSAVLEKRTDEVCSYRSGKKQLLAFFIGRVMELTGGRADPVRVNQILRSKLDEQSD